MESVGLVVTHYHKILRLKQQSCLKPYIEFNINKRKLAKIKFEIQFYKGLCKGLFGKTVPN